MTFLEASRILAGFSGGPALPIHLVSSGNVDPLLIYLRAAAATRGRTAEVRMPPFGTLGQTLLAPRCEREREVLLLMPWDFVPDCDWRSGLPSDPPRAELLLDDAQAVARRIVDRQSPVFYVPAPLPPIYADPDATASLAMGLLCVAAGLRAHILDAGCFALGGYLASGVAIAGTRMAEVAEAMVDALVERAEGAAKILVTDLDDVMWAGLAAEDGPDGVECGSEGRGFRHFLYQGLLARVKASGVLLAAVSRNDLDVACAPIEAGRTLLAKQDFVAIRASYEPKSVHLARLAATLNLGLDAFVYVDDNPIELAEVGAALPAITRLQFPSHDDQLPAFLDNLARLFARSTITDEDRQRTEMYRSRSMSMPQSSPEVGEGADLTAYLTQLRMALTICDRSRGDRQRAVQLINKTNQFNLNGVRLTDQAVNGILAAGGTLYTVRLDDRTGTHGEILACLVDHVRRIRALVMSCRVFQRRVEHVFLLWLAGQLGGDLDLAYAPTERNTPLREFLMDPAFTVGADGARLDSARFAAAHAAHRDLFTLKAPVVD